MATRAQVPRADGESSIGVPTKKWGNIFAYKIDEATSLGNNAGLGYRQPSTAQSIGDIKYHATLPAGWYLECTTAGTTGSGALTITSPTVGGTVSDGTVTWTIRKNASTQDLTGYLPLSGGAMTGTTGISKVNDDTYLYLSGGSNAALIRLYGKDYANAAGAFEIDASEGPGTTKELIGYTSGTLTWNGNSLDKSAVVAESLGANGYRKYASGLIEQWGDSGAVEDIPGVGYCFKVQFPISFSTVYRFITTPKNLSSQISNESYGCTMVEDVSSNSIVYVKKYTVSNTLSTYQGSVQWHAIGY